MALCIESVLSKEENQGRDIVVNLSTSNTNRDIAEKYGGYNLPFSSWRTKCSEEMKKETQLSEVKGSGGLSTLSSTLLETVSWRYYSYSICSLVKIKAK